MRIIKFDVEYSNFNCPVTGAKIAGSDSDDHSVALMPSVCETGLIIHSGDSNAKQLYGL